MITLSTEPECTLAMRAIRQERSIPIAVRTRRAASRITCRRTVAHQPSEHSCDHLAVTTSHPADARFANGSRRVTARHPVERPGWPLPWATRRQGRVSLVFNPAIYPAQLGQHLTASPYGSVSCLGLSCGAPAPAWPTGWLDQKLVRGCPHERSRIRRSVISTQAGADCQPGSWKADPSRDAHGCRSRRCCCRRRHAQAHPCVGVAQPGA